MGTIFEEKFEDLISLALTRKEMYGIVDVLQKIAESVDASGCILWETDPWANVESVPPTGKLYVFASWFSDEINLLLRELDIDKSANGRAIVSGEIISIPDMNVDPRTHKDDYSRHEAKLTSMCIAPIKLASDHYNASLSVYRKDAVRPFTEEEQKFIAQVARLIPQLDQAIRDKVRRYISDEIIKILEAAKNTDKPVEDDTGDQVVLKEAFQEVCDLVARTFSCIEVSLFLENRFEKENLFKLIATSYSDWTGEKKTYRPEQDKGHLTGWVLRNKLPVSIFDLGNFERDKEKLRVKYEDIDWQDSLNIKQAAQKILDRDHIPPLSFMAAPIINDDRLLGVIRCCTARTPPWFFSDRQQRILELIARHIGRFWSDRLQHISDRLQHIEEQKESETWKTFVQEVSLLNHKVQKRIDKSDLNEERLYEQILKLAHSSIKNSDILSIRLRDEKTDELYFAETLGFPGAKQEVEALKKKRFPLNERAYKRVPLGVLVFKDGKARSNADVDDYRSETFPKTERILVAAIGVQDDIIGVLDIRGTSSKPFPQHALRMAELLGRQLGLYLSLWKSEQQQRQAFEDLWHQLKGPARHTFKRAEELVRDVNTKWKLSDGASAEQIEKALLKLRGVSRKAKRVAVNAGVFKELASEGRIKIPPDKLLSLKSEKILQMIIAAGVDTRLMLEEDEDVRFFTHKKGFAELESNDVKVNFDLLEQAVNCLLDNAGKYSFPNALVTTSGGIEVRDGARFFYVSVRNWGFEIPEEEIPQLTKRYYRGKWAKRTTGEGSGIGLWVVDHIMQAHGGSLVIMKTDSKGENEVRLVFPVSKARA